MITEFEVWNCRFRSEKPESSRTVFYFDYDVVFIDASIRYRIEMNIKETISREIVHDFRFSDGSIIRVGSLRTILCRHSAAHRLLDAQPFQYTWGYHIIWLADGAGIDNVGDSWNCGGQRSREEYTGIVLSLNLPYLEWVETTPRSATGSALSKPTRYDVANYRREFPDNG
jgi:hypothetical protein